MPTPAQIRPFQLALAASAARLTQADAEPEPLEARIRWHYLCRRRTLLEGLVADAKQLALAHRRLGDAAAAAAVGELVEHYQHGLGLAHRALDLHQPEMARALQRFTPPPTTP